MFMKSKAPNKVHIHTNENRHNSQLKKGKKISNKVCGCYFKDRKLKYSKQKRIIYAPLGYLTLCRLNLFSFQENIGKYSSIL